MAEKNDLITNRKDLLDNDGGKTENSSKKGLTQERYESGPAENQSQNSSKKGQTQERYESGPAENQSQNSSKKGQTQERYESGPAENQSQNSSKKRLTQERYESGPAENQSQNSSKKGQTQERYESGPAENQIQNSSKKGQTQERYESGPAENRSQEQSKNDSQNEILENRYHEGEDETNVNENCSETCEEINEIHSSELPVDCLPVGKHDKEKEKCHDNALSMFIDINKMKYYKKFICIDVNSYHKTKLVAISKFEIDLDLLNQILRRLDESGAIKKKSFKKPLPQLKTFYFGNFPCIPAIYDVYNVSELSDSESESENENESSSGLQGNNQGENQQSVEPENGAVDRNFDELDSAINSNEVRQQTAAIGQAASDVHPSAAIRQAASNVHPYDTIGQAASDVHPSAAIRQAASNVHPSAAENDLPNSPDLIRNLRRYTSSASYRNVVIDLSQVPASSQRIVQENIIDLRQDPVPTQRIVQAMEDIPNIISSPTDDTINVQNTQGNVSINSEQSFMSQHLFEEDAFCPGNTTTPTVERVHCQPSDGGPSEMCIGSVPRRPISRASEMCIESVSRLISDNGPIRRASESLNPYHENSFRGLPVMLQILSGRSSFNNTCTIDTSLMIIFYQMLTNRDLYQLFINSIYDIFRTDLPDMLSLFRIRDFDDVRREWSEIIRDSARRDFYGSDARFMMRPFSSLLLCHYRYYCSNLHCPSNNRQYDMPGINLRRLPAGAYLDITTLQQLIDSSSISRQYPCNEDLVQTISESRAQNARYTYVPCSGHLLVTRTVRDIPEQPPMIMINMGRSGLQGRHIRDLNGTVQVGAYHYYIGGLTFAANNHFTGRILLPHHGRTLLYCNGQGIRDLGDNEEHPDYLNSYLSLVILFRFI
ncbi:uncharacterized protein LOC134686606 [Mytilus trossulus]|uniref:uncharacterized protein LOC134686606 n=1 Tax=Mytilus trossulus TaxID=6551 RepID=UPI003007D91B